MALATLFNIPGAEDTLLQFSFANQDEHFKITSKINDVFDLNTTNYPLDPIPLHDFGAWLYTHQQAHNTMNAVLGIIGNDLTGLDLKDRAQVAAWIWLHANEHVQAANILRLK